MWIQCLLRYDLIIILVIAELGEELKKVLAENILYYFCLFAWNICCLIVMEVLRLYHYIPKGIATAMMSPGLVGHLAFTITFILNMSVVSKLRKGELDRVLKFFRRWDMMTSLFILQPRAHGVMKELLKHVEAEEKQDDSRRGEEEDEGEEFFSL